MSKGKLFNRSIAIIIMLVSLCCMVVVIMSMFNLPDVPLGHTEIESHESSKFGGIYSKGGNLGMFGKMMVEMLPNDLAFTVFVPSERAFERDLRLRANHNFSQEEWDNTYATVSRVLGFSAVPRKIYSDSVLVGKEISFDSISGFTLYISKDLDGVLVVNSVRSERVGVEKGEVVVHTMDGVIMDAEFEQSVQPHDDEQE